MLGLHDPWAAFCLDEALYLRLVLTDDEGYGEAPDSAEERAREAGIRAGVPPPLSILNAIPLAEE